MYFLKEVQAAPKEFTNVPIVVVLPVPAYPFKRNKASLSSLNIKLLSNSNNLPCFIVGLWGNFSNNSLLKSAGISIIN